MYSLWLLARAERNDEKRWRSLEWQEMWQDEKGNFFFYFPWISILLIYILPLRKLDWGKCLIWLCLCGKITRKKEKNEGSKEENRKGGDTKFCFILFISGQSRKRSIPSSMCRRSSNEAYAQLLKCLQIRAII